MFYYSIANYFDRQGLRDNVKYSNIKKHINAFLDVKEYSKEFILVSFVDTPRGHAHYENVKRHLEEFCLLYLPNRNYHVIVEYNWGGTIAALWYTYKFLSSNNEEGYVAHMEEDFGPKNNSWYNALKRKLNDYLIYVGESDTGKIKRGNDDTRITHPAFHNTRRLGDPEVWTDGGFYFSTIDRMRTMEKRIGIFHKGSQETKYNRVLDGISLGEVGFPTLLHHARFNFGVVNRQDYFINEWSE